MWGARRRRAGRQCDPRHRPRQGGARTGGRARRAARRVAVFFVPREGDVATLVAFVAVLVAFLAWAVFLAVVAFEAALRTGRRAGFSGASPVGDRGASCSSGPGASLETVVGEPTKES